MTLELEIRRGSPPDGWDDTVRRLGGSVFHSTLWAEYQRKATGAEPVFLFGRDRQGGLAAGAVGLFRKSPWPGASLLLRHVVFAAHPLVAGGDAVLAGDFLRRCEEWARAAGCARISLGSFMSGASPLVPGAHGYRETRRVEFLVDLRRDRDSLWKAIRKDQRERIRRLEREGVSVEATTRPEDIQGLASVRQATQEKRSERGQVYEVRADETFSADLYDHLVKQGAARLFVARRAGDVLAALFFVTFNDRAYSVYSGSTEAGYRIGAQSGLFWTAVERFKDEGFELLNRGGVPASAEDESHPLHGIYLFKLRLGTTPTVCRSGTKVLSKFRDRLVRLRAGLRG
jgi:hypothetical protein